MDCKCGLKYYLEEGRNLVESFDETGELTSTADKVNENLAGGTIPIWASSFKCVCGNMLTYW